jgi:hypothetical protein
MSKRERKVKVRQDPALRLARTILPAAQVRRGDFTLVDVANHTEGDQRHTVRSGETKTLRRKPKLQTLVTTHTITQAEADTCQWYIDKHSAGYDTVGIVANYGGTTGSGGTTSFTHLCRSKAQSEARHAFAAARTAINPMLLPLFEKVVLHNRPLGRLSRSFRLAVAQLNDHLESVGEAA